MKMIHFLTVIVLLWAFSISGLEIVNGRVIPDEDDFASLGGGWRWEKYDSLLSELANILSATKNVDHIDVDMVVGDSISTTVSVVSGDGGVDIDTIINCDAAAIEIADLGIATLDTLEFADNDLEHPLQGILKTSVVTIGHVGETTTDFAFTTAANTTEQNLGTDTIPAYARIIDVVIINTEAVAGISVSFSIEVGDGSSTNEYGTSTDLKGINSLIAGDASESILVMPITSETIIYVGGTPNSENWSAMSAGEWTLITTYLDYGAVRTKF